MTEGGVLRAEGISSLESLSLTIAQADVGSLESVSNDYGRGSALKISDAELTSLDLDIIGKNTSLKAYDGNGVLRAVGASSLDSLSLDHSADRMWSSLESVSRRLRKRERLEDKRCSFELTSLDLDIIGQNTSSKAYDGNGVLRARGHLKPGEPKSDHSAGGCGQLRECIKRLRKRERLEDKRCRAYKS